MQVGPNTVEACRGRWRARLFVRRCLLGLLCLAGFGGEAVAAAAAEVMVPLVYRENGWRGEAELAGRFYAFEVPASLVVRNPRTPPGFLVIRSGEERNRPNELLGGRQRGGCDISKNVFLDNHLWQVRVVSEGTATNAQPKLRFQEIPAKTGELKLGGDFIREVRLEGVDTVLLFNPPPAVPVPAGLYQNHQIAYLAAPGKPVEAFVISYDHLTVTAGKTTVFDVGGPLRSSIQVSQSGRTLRLIHRLTGIGGLPVVRTGQANPRPPAFAIYQGDRRLAAGQFEYG